jgi:hypothetical protein
VPEFYRRSPLILKISLPIGSVHVVAEERESVNVTVTPLGNSRQDREAAEATDIRLADDELTIEAPKGTGYMRGSAMLKFEVHVPIDSSLRIGVASASVRCHGRYQVVSITSASGDIEVDDATGNVKLQTASGGVQINDVGGKFSVKTASGEIKANDVVGPTILRTASGDIEIASVQTGVRSKSASGDLNIASAHSGEIRADSASGDIAIGVMSGTVGWLDLDSSSGRITNHLDESASKPDSVELKIRARTASGDIDILRAPEKSTV